MRPCNRSLYMITANANCTMEKKIRYAELHLIIRVKCAMIPRVRNKDAARKGGGGGKGGNVMTVEA